MPLVKTLSTFAIKYVPDTLCWHHQSFCEECIEIPPCSFISNDQTPNISIPLFCVVGLLDSVSDSCHIISHYVFSSSLGSIVLSLPSCCQPFHLFRSHLCNTHSSLPIFLIFFHCISLFHLWPFLLNGSLIFLALTSLSAELSPPKLPHVSSLSCFTFLICFFSLCLMFHGLASVSLLSLCLCFSLPYRSSSWAVCQVTLNLCQPGGTHR